MLVEQISPATHELNRINMLRESDVHFWCRTFDVSPAQLRAAVQHVGPQADAVRRYLLQAAQRPS